MEKLPRYPLPVTPNKYGPMYNLITLDSLSLVGLILSLNTTYMLYLQFYSTQTPYNIETIRKNVIRAIYWGAASELTLFHRYLPIFKI